MLRDEADSRMDQTDIAQPGLFAVQVGLVRCLADAGIHPAAVVGHSAGELAACMVSGAFDLETAAQIVHARSHHQEKTAGTGAMAAIGMNVEEAESLLEAFPDLVVAGDNGLGAVSVAGDPEQIDALVSKLEDEETFARKLALNYAFHSPLMDAIEEGFREDVAGLTGKPTTVPFYSTVTGGHLPGEEMNNEYWWNNLRQPVQFRSAIRALLDDGHRAFVEVGPHPNLIGYVKGMASAEAIPVVALETLKRKTDEVERLSKTILDLAVGGCALDLSGKFGGTVPPLALPAYPWQREYHFHKPKPGGGLASEEDGHPILGGRMKMGDPVWAKEFSLSEVPSIADHKVRGGVILPAVAYLEVALAAANDLRPEQTVVLEDVQIEKALRLEEGSDRLLQTALDETDHGFSIHSASMDSDEPAFERHVQGTFGHRPPEAPVVDIDAIRSRTTETLNAQTHYSAAHATGLEYGPFYQTVGDSHIGDTEVLSELLPRETVDKRFLLDPTLIDGAVQGLIILVAARQRRGLGVSGLFLPVRIKRVEYYRPTTDFDGFYAHTRLVDANKAFMLADIDVCGPQGELLVRLIGLEVRYVGSAGGQTAHYYHHELVPIASFGDATVEHATAPMAESRSAASADAFDAAMRTLVGAYAAEAFAALDGAAIAPEQDAYAERLRSLAATSDTTANELWRGALRQFPERYSDLLLIARVGSRLHQILRGEIDPESVLGATESPLSFEHLFEQGAGFHAINKAQAENLAVELADFPNDRIVRILEIDGGTGGLTAHALPLLEGRAFTYVFSDPSADSVADAEKRFAGTEGFAAISLDAADGEAVTGLDGPFDIILAGPRSFAKRAADWVGLRSQLVPNGLLLVSELAPTQQHEFIFGALGVPTTADPAYEIAAANGFQHLAERPQAAGKLLMARAPLEPQEQADAERVDKTEADPGLLLVMGLGGTADVLAGDLEAAAAAQDRNCRCIRAGELQGDQSDAFLAGEDAELEALVESLAEDPPSEIVVVAPNKRLADPLLTNEGYILVALVKAVAAAAWPTSPRLTVVTQGLFGAEPNVSGMAFWGLGRTISNEYPNWRSRRIDVAETADAQNRLCDWIVRGGTGGIKPDAVTADEIRIDGHGVSKLRLVPLDGPEEPLSLNAESDTGYSVGLTSQGSLENLVVRAKPSGGELAPREVRIDVKSASLNFKDVILALGLLPPALISENEAGFVMGLEAAGVVRDVGSEVDDLGSGDRVFLFGEGCLTSDLVTDRRLVMRIPDHWSFDDAVTIPAAGLTAIYSLKVQARLEPGETVLIHGGAGGVGLFAIQYAKAIGARVIASAGTEEKRDLLRALGVDCVTDSRSLQFEADVHDYTDGEGVDVVLNSLSGDAMLTSIGLLRPYGRFVEIGKRDFDTNSRLNMRALENNISYYAVDLGRTWLERPELVEKLWASMVEEWEEGRIYPLPRRVFPLARIKEAFKTMRAGRHVGKLVIDMGGENLTVLPSNRAVLPALATDKVHIVTGGLGGLGLNVARWMAERGAGTIVLVGRSGVTNDEQKQAIESIQELGTRIEVAKLDVSDDAEVEAFIADVSTRIGPVGGVVHSVLVLDDQLIANTTSESFATVSVPKTLGAWSLHRHTLNQPMDYFICFSSIATIVGNPGQASYVAANAILDQMMIARRAAGLPGLSLALGPVGDAGVVARNQDVAESLSRGGVGTIAVSEVLQALDLFIASERCEAAVLNLAGPLRLPIASSERLSDVALQGLDAGGQDAGPIDLTAVPEEERLDVVETIIRESLAAITGSKAGRITPDQTPDSAGLDSLMAVELGATLERRLGTTLTTADLAMDRTIREIAVGLILRLAPPADGTVVAGAADDSGNRNGIIDWERECQLDPELIADGAAPPQEGHSILVTGSNGFLGAFIVARLLNDTDAVVTCLVRAKDEKTGKARLNSAFAEYGLDADADSPRINVVVGDLCQPLMGLDEVTYDRLVDHIDTIYHSAATLNFFQSYRALAEQNVDSTRHVLRFAFNGRIKRLHHISTAFVFDTLALIGQPVQEDTALVSPDAIRVGYSQTKWVAEQLVWEAGRRGLPISVHRPPFISAATTTGVCRSDDFLSLTTLAGIEVGGAADSGYLWYIAPVDYVAEAIVRLSRQPGSDGKAWHPFIPAPVTNAHLTEWGRDMELEAEMLSPQAWVSRARALIRDTPDHPAIRLLPFWEKAFETGLDDAGNMPLFGSEATQSALADLGVAPRSFDRPTFLAMLDYLLRKNGMPVPARIR